MWTFSTIFSMHERAAACFWQKTTKPLWPPTQIRHAWTGLLTVCPPQSRSKARKSVSEEDCWDNVGYYKSLYCLHSLRYAPPPAPSPPPFSPSSSSVRVKLSQREIELQKPKSAQTMFFCHVVTGHALLMAKAKKLFSLENGQMEVYLLPQKVIIWQ